MGADEEHGAAGHSPLDSVVIPVFRAVLQVINLVKEFSPIDSLSTGRSITWGAVGTGVRANRAAAGRDHRLDRRRYFQPARTGDGAKPVLSPQSKVRNQKMQAV